MQIDIYLPSEGEAEVSYDEQTRKLYIVRLFQTSGYQTLGNVLVSGKSGQEERSVLAVSGNTGQIRNTKVTRDKECPFDKPPGAGDGGQRADAATIVDTDEQED